MSVMSTSPRRRRPARPASPSDSPIRSAHPARGDRRSSEDSPRNEVLRVSITGSTIHLTVDTAAQASTWYQEAFGATEANRIVLPGDKLIHVEMHLGDLTLMLADEFPEMSSFGPKHFGGTYSAIYLHVDDVDT